MKAIFPESFSSKFEVMGDCWIWTAGKTRTGYGTFALNKRKYMAHRFAWICANGDIPEGLYACHKCDTPSCVNPDHLFLGTQKENIRDMINKNRIATGDRHGMRKHPHLVARGERAGCSKLTSDQVKEIRNLYRPGKAWSKSEFSTAGLAEKFGVCKQQIHRIATGKQWEVLS